MKIINTANLHLFIDLENSHGRFGMHGTLKDRFDPSDCHIELIVLEHEIHIYQFFLSLQVSPHEFLQAVMKASKKRFRIGMQSDPVEFMSWLLNTLHADLKTKKNKSIIYDCFQVYISSFFFAVHFVVSSCIFTCAYIESTTHLIGRIGGCERNP